MQPGRFTICCRCARPLVCTEELRRWLEAVARAGARIYCSLECSTASEALELTGDVVLEASSPAAAP